MIRVFIGQDFRELSSFHVLQHSIFRHARLPVSIAPLKLDMLPMYARPYKNQTNEFTYSRFLVPYLCDYQGWAIFMDCDMMFRADISELWDAAQQNGKAVSVVKHEYVPRTDTKALGVQIPYPRKNWSSLMVMDCSKCTKLTPDFVNTAAPADLHRFAWVDDSEIGELSLDWNHLVGEYEPNPNAKNVHWTIGGPWFYRYRDVEFADEWRRNYFEAMSHLDGVHMEDKHAS